MVGKGTSGCLRSLQGTASAVARGRNVRALALMPSWVYLAVEDEMVF